MSNEVMIALITGASAVSGAAITSYFNHRSIKATTDLSTLKDKYAASRKELIRIYRQVAAYHQLEDIVTQDQLAARPNVDPRAIKKEMRDRVEGAGAERPEITRRQAESRIRELETEV